MDTFKKIQQGGFSEIVLHNSSKDALLIKQAKDLIIVDRNNVDQLITALTEFKTWKIKKCDFTRQT